MSFDWTRPVPPEWQADLDQLAPGDRVTSLKLSWLAGTPDAPVQRWVIHEITPGAAVEKILDEERRAGHSTSFLGGIWKDLQGPDPRVVGKWIPVERGSSAKRWVSTSMISRNQWDLHKQTGGLPLLCWIIEGAKGGHAWQFGPFERAFLLEHGIEPEIVQQMAELWPNPGSQPYADYNRLTFEALAERDLLRNWRQAMPWEDRSRRTQAGLILAGTSKDQRQRTTIKMMQWLDNQIGEAVSDIPRTLLPQWSEFGTTETAFGDDEQLHNSLAEE